MRWTRYSAASTGATTSSGSSIVRRSEPFYSAIAGVGDVFETKTVGLARERRQHLRRPGADGRRRRAGQQAGSARRPAARDPPHLPSARRRLLLFETLDSMVRAWGVSSAREFFARCCPLLLEVGAVAYWTMSARTTPATVRDTVQAVTQCVLHVDERSVRVVKAEGRDDAVRGSVLHWHEEGGRAVLAPPEIVGRVAASLRAVRRARKLSQHDLGDLAGVTASAISQVERSERGLSLATLVRLSAALGVTIDDLLRGEDPGAYRIGRRTADPQRGLGRRSTLLGGGASDLRIDLVHLDAREAGGPRGPRRGTGIVAVASGLVQVTGRRLDAGASGTARSWWPTASRSTAGATSARPRRCSSGSSSPGCTCARSEGGYAGAASSAYPGSRPRSGPSSVAARTSAGEHEPGADRRTRGGSRRSAPRRVELAAGEQVVGAGGRRAWPARPGRARRRPAGVVLTRPEARPASLGRGARHRQRHQRRERQARRRRRAAASPAARRRRSRRRPARGRTARSPATISARPGQQRRARAEARDQPRREAERQRADRQRHRQERQADLERVVAEHALQVERAEEEHPEHARPPSATWTRFAPGHVARAEDAQRHQRVRGASPRGRRTPPAAPATTAPRPSVCAEPQP